MSRFHEALRSHIQNQTMRFQDDWKNPATQTVLQSAAVIPLAIALTACSQPDAHPTTVPLSKTPFETTPTLAEVNAQELALWRQGYQKPATPLPLNNETGNYASEKLTNTIALMRRSSVGGLRDSGELIAQLIISKDIAFEFLTTIRTNDNQHAAMQVQLTSINTQNNAKKFLIKLGIDLNYLTNNTTSLDAAILLVHEAQHIRSIIQRASQQVQNGSSIEQAVQTEAARTQDKQTILEEELSAYTAQTKVEATMCTILPAQGVNSICNSERVTIFNQAKGNPQDSRWRDFIKEKILGFK